MKSESAMYGCFTISRSIVFASLLSGLLIFCVITPMLIAQEPTKPAPAPELKKPLPVEAITHTMPVVNAQVREAWRKTMVKTPRPKHGCFKAEYPKTEWEEVQCGRPSPHMNPKRGKAKVNQVGNGNDYAIQAYGTNKMSSAEGSFMPTAGGSSANGVSGYVAGTTTTVNNVFMLQINSQAPFNVTSSPFPTPACSGAPNGAAGCYGWEQYLFSQTQGPAPGAGQQSVPGATGTTPGVFIEYWLMNWGTPCPALPSWMGTGTWSSDGAGDCVFNGPMTYVPPQTAAELPGLVMTATSSSSEDTVSLSTTSGIYTYSEPNVLSLYQSWTQAEFNVFGDCCGTEVNFTSPTVLVLKTSIDDGSTNIPSCEANDGTTGETNNLTFEPNATPVCCPYGGTNPAIEFAEDYDTSTTHTAWCGATQIQGDPHITTTNNKVYNFQGAGEYVTLRDSDGTEIQTRETPVPTASTLNQPPMDLGLITCVSLNTAVAARVGKHRVTYEPNFSGAYDTSGLQLRIDGKVTTLGASGVDLGDGGRVTKSSEGNGIEIYFPDGKTMSATQAEYASMWYLNVDIANLGMVSDAGRASIGGLAGPIPAGSWLPALPNGALVGPEPANLHDRYVAVYDKFGAAWRVTNSNSLFDYAPGTSTATFTNTAWPKENPPCTVPSTKAVKIQLPVAKPVSAAVAEEACKSIKDATLHSNCVFDVQVTGYSGFAEHYAVTQRVHEKLNIKPIVLRPEVETKPNLQ